MDKSQRELINTYLRKRNIAAEQDEKYYFNKTESLYLISHPENLNQFKLSDGRLNDNVATALLKYGEDKEAMGKYLGNVSITNAMYNTSYLLNDDDISNRREMAEFILSHSTNKLYSHDLAYVVEAAPDLLTPQQILEMIKNQYTGEYDIAMIIANKPEMIDSFDTSKYNVSSINLILSKNPSLYVKFKNKLEQYNENDLTQLMYKMKGQEYAVNKEKRYELMLKQFYLTLMKFNFFYYYLFDNHNKFKPYDIANLLKINPKMADKVDMNSISKYDIKDILIAHPSLFSKLDTSKLDKYDVVDMINKQPLLLNYFDLNKFHESDIVNIIKANPSAIDKFDLSKIQKYYLRDIIINNPILLDKVGVNNFSKYDIRNILIAQPILATKFDLSDLSGYEVASLITEQPKILKYLSKENLDKLDSYDIRDLIIKHPSLIKYFDLTKLRSWDIKDILLKKPNLVVNFDFDKMSRWDKEDLINDVPKIKQYINNSNG